MINDVALIEVSLKKRNRVLYVDAALCEIREE